MRRFFSISLVAVVAFSLAQQAKSPSDQLLGVWKYDMASLKIEPNAKTKAFLNDPKSGKAARESMEKLRKSLIAMLKPLRLTFKKDLSFVIATAKPSEKKFGTWNIHERHVHVVMTDGGQATPQMEIDKSGKRIHTVYTDDGFGSAKIDLIRAQ